MGHHPQCMRSMIMMLIEVELNSTAIVIEFLK